MSKSKILVLISGSIAAYKACYLISKLVQNNFEVKVAASNSALNFIGQASLEGLSNNKVSCDTFENGGAMEHINLIRWADLIICAPATANFINKLSNGIGDDLLSTIALAHDFKKPFLICPAMNTQMYLNPITQKSVKNLREYGFNILETQSGVLACGEIGLGKLLDPDLIFEEIIKQIPIDANIKKPITQKGKKILICSGGTIEKIDNVRAIHNISTGKTGAKLAEILYGLGHEIHFIGAQNGAMPIDLNSKNTFTDFKSLEHILFEKIEKNEFDLIIQCAAISDYSVKEIISNNGQIIENNGKISSSEDEIKIVLAKNPKLLNQIKTRSLAKNTKLIGFKLTENSDDKSILNAINKQFEEANCDYIVQNSIVEINSEKQNHKYNFYKNGEIIPSKCNGIFDLAMKISEEIL